MPSSTHWNIQSTWSKAGIGTSIVLELKKPPTSSTSNAQQQQQQQQQPSKKSKSSPRIAFDIGCTPCFDDSIPAKYIFISHGHIDHVGALFSHARAHSVSYGGAAPTYFVPAQLMPQIKQCQVAMSNLDAMNIQQQTEGECSDNGNSRRESLINMNLVAVHPGDEIVLKGINYGSKTSFFMRAFKVDHAGHPALGYIIGSRTTSGLKAEYQKLNGKELKELVKSGISIKDPPIEKIEVGYTGDTCANGLMKQQIPNSDDERTTGFDIGQMFRAEVLLCELTFLDSSEGEEQRIKARQRGHLHINDLEAIFSSHNQLGDDDAESNNTTIIYPKSIIFYHLSAKYRPAKRAMNYIAEGLPQQLIDRCYVAISSMLTQEEQACDFSISKPNGCVSLKEYQSWKDAVDNVMS